MMVGNRYLLVAHATLLFFSHALVARVTSKSFFAPSSSSHRLSTPYILSEYRYYHNNYDQFRKPYVHPEHRAACNIEFATSYQASTRSGALASYFFKDHKAGIVVRQDGGGNVASKWFGLFARPGSTYHSIVTASPKRSVSTATLSYYHDVSTIVDNVWFAVMVPIVRVEHALHLEEVIQGPRGANDGIETFIDALNQPSWRFGRWPTSVQRASGVDNLSLRVGWNMHADEEWNCALYGMIHIPLAPRGSSEVIFEPLLGDALPMQLGCGINGMHTFYKHDDVALTYVGHVRYSYALPADQYRSFDLTGNGQWSRYLFVARRGAATTPLPGINFFTREATVSDVHTFQLLAGVHGQVENYHFELGYSAWMRSAEKVRLTCPNDIAREAVGIFDPNAVNIQDGTASSATIDQAFGQVISDDFLGNVFTTITAHDFNLSSAQHPAAVTHTLHASVATVQELYDTYWMVGLGVSYEYAQSNSALSQWALWAKVVLSF